MPISRRDLLTAHLPALLWLVTVTVALAMPQRSFADLPPWWPEILHFQALDKVVHFLLFALLALLLGRSLRRLPAVPRPLLFAFLAATLYGLALEVGQETLTDRSGEVADWLADTAGAGVGVAPLAARERRR